MWIRWGLNRAADVACQGDGTTSLPRAWDRLGVGIARRRSQPRGHLAGGDAAGGLGRRYGAQRVPLCFAVPLAFLALAVPNITDRPTDRPTQPCRGGGIGAGTPALRGVIAERRARRPGAAETGRRRGPGVARADRGPARAARRPAEAQPARDDPRRARGRGAARAGPGTVSRCRRHHRPATRRPRGGGDRRGVLRTRRPRPPLRPCPARPSRRSRRPHRSRRRPS